MKQQDENECGECEPAVDIERPLSVPEDRNERQDGAGERSATRSDPEERHHETLSHRVENDDRCYKDQNARDE